jgi:hypothetical protein
LGKGALELFFQFAIGKLVGDHIRHFSINPKMIHRIDHSSDRDKKREKKDKERMMADEFCPPYKKTDGIGSSLFYHRKGSEEINLRQVLYNKEYPIKKVKNRSSPTERNPKNSPLASSPGKDHREY